MVRKTSGLTSLKRKSKVKPAVPKPGVRHLPFKNTVWSVDWSYLQDNWSEILMEVLVLDRESYRHNAAEPALGTDAEGRGGDRWIFQTDSIILDGTQAEICILPARLPDKDDVVDDDILYILESFSEYKIQLLERQNKEALRKKAVESLQPWQKEALNLS